jgi:lipoic acid synthetase
MGTVCTRACRFCSFKKGTPGNVNYEIERNNILKAIQILGLRHVVITSPARDDLSDGGAYYFARLTEEIHRNYPIASVELLIPDFQGKKKLIQLVLQSRPSVIGHNIETVRRMFPIVRPLADFNQSLSLLRYMKEYTPDIITKSGFMVGFGETPDEIFDLLKQLKEVSCDIITVGQYLQPTVNQIAVEKIYSSKEYRTIEQMGKQLHIPLMYVDTMVRSSYNARDAYIYIKKKYGT